MKGGIFIKYHNHHNSLFSNKLQNIFIVVLIIATISVIAYGTINDKKEQQKTDKIIELENIRLKEKQQVIEESNYDLYDKIKNKKDIIILVIGDGIGASIGTGSENAWFLKLRNWFRTSYSINADVKSITHQGGGINDGIKEYEADKGTEYDLVLFCYGQNDRTMNIDEWSKKYESLSKEVISKNPKSDLILLIESSFLTGKGDRVSIPDRIKKLAYYYNIQDIDMRDIFQNSGKEYSQLSVDGTSYPNDEGYDLYFKAISNLIDQNIKDNKKVNYISKENLFK